MQRRYFNTGPAGREYSWLEVMSTDNPHERVLQIIDGLNSHRSMAVVLNQEQCSNLAQALTSQPTHEPMWEDF